MAANQIYSINGPVVTIKDTTDFFMMEMVYVGKMRLIGEVIATNTDITTVQVYEDTVGLCAGEPVEGSGEPMSAALGPGILAGIFDGIGRQLEAISEQSGAFIPKGISGESLNQKRQWDVIMKSLVGDELSAGEIYAVCPETSAIEHRMMVPPRLSGRVVWAAENGLHRINDCILKLEDKEGKIHELTMAQRWPIKVARPVSARLPISRPLLTGQRIIDTMFPIGKGGAAAIPGGFGTGKTMTQHQLAKWCDADIIVYIGCGERGNEMTQVLEEFRGLTDPKSGRPLTERTILIANTSNMPVAAREASIYTGITLAEYYRDMGYHVAIMADSTSRWAEALREISGRLEEMPAEEGFPAYLPSRLSAFYERAGYMVSLCGAESSVTIIGAVSPQSSDFSEPVTQNTKRFVRTFWALDKSLAYARHYPAIDWNTSYSGYADDLAVWFSENESESFLKYRQRLTSILHQESELMEIVKLIGSDVLPDDQKLTIEIAKLIRVGFLQQSAFHRDDTYVPLGKQRRMMEVILYLNDRCREIISRGNPISLIMVTGLFEKATRMKYDITNDRLELFDAYKKEIDEVLSKIA